MTGGPTLAAILSVQVGPVAPLGPSGIPSGFRKGPADGRVAIGWLGLAGDAQADLTVHGGPDKAVYVYPDAHYARWQAELPQHAALLQAGGFGENLTVSNLDEDTACIGDVFDVGSARLQGKRRRDDTVDVGSGFGVAGGPTTQPWVRS